MLVLSRKTDEQIVIGEQICIKVSKIAGNRVSIAIDAPPEVLIRRGELEPQQLTRRTDEGRGNSDAASLHVAAYHA